MEGEDVGAGFGEGVYELCGVGHHEVYVEQGFGEVLAKAAADVGAHCEIGDEVAIHDVEVQPVCAGTGRACDAFAGVGEDVGAVVAQVCEVGGENAGRDHG